MPSLPEGFSVVRSFGSVSFVNGRMAQVFKPHISKRAEAVGCTYTRYIFGWACLLHSPTEASRQPVTGHTSVDSRASGSGFRGRHVRLHTGSLGRPVRPKCTYRGASPGERIELAAPFLALL